MDEHNARVVPLAAELEAAGITGGASMAVSAMLLFPEGVLLKENDYERHSEGAGAACQCRWCAKVRILAGCEEALADHRKVKE